MCLFDWIQLIYQIYTYLTVLARHHMQQNRSNPSIPHPVPPSSACIPFPVPPSPSSLSLSLAPQPSTAGPPSLRPVSMLFHLACCYRGLDAGRLQLGSQSFSIYQSAPTSPHTHIPVPPFPTPPPQLFHFQYPHQSQSRHTALFLIIPMPLVPFKPPYLSFSMSAKNVAHKTQKVSKK